MSKITPEAIKAGLSAQVIDYRADPSEDKKIAVERAMRRYGFHHPIDGAEMVQAIIEAALPHLQPAALDEAAVLRHAASVLFMWEGDPNLTGYMGDFKDACSILELLAQHPTSPVQVFPKCVICGKLDVFAAGDVCAPCAYQQPAQAVSADTQAVIREYLDAEEAFRDATRNNWGPDKRLGHTDPVLLRLRDARTALRKMAGDAIEAEPPQAVDLDATQPSPAGQGDALSLIEEAIGYLDLIPVQPPLVDQARRVLARALKAALAARQPVGQEPVTDFPLTLRGLIAYGQVAGNPSQGAVSSHMCDLIAQMVPHLKRLDAMESALPAQAVDLGQFWKPIKEAVHTALSTHAAALSEKKRELIAVYVARQLRDSSSKAVQS